MTEPAIRRLDRADLSSVVALAAGLERMDEEHRYRLLFDTSEEGLITGCGGQWSKPGQTVIGPVIAPHDAAATALANDLAAPVAGQIRIEYGDDHPAVGGWETHHGVPQSGTTSLMTLGRQSLPDDRHRLYMPVTLALG